MQSPTPRVSIGLPVYNGARFLAAALDSILGQSFDDFELIVSDNASTDATPEICRHFAERDSRVRYVRNETNLGGARNFSNVFGLARGEYFKWASHDDVMAPDFLERCVEALDADPSVILCFSRMRVIGPDGFEKKSDFSNDLRELDSTQPSARFGDLVLTGHGCFHVWGVMRREDAAETPLIADYIGSDRGFLAELALRGRFRELSEDLFSLRDHPGRSVRAMPFYLRAEWFDPPRMGKRVFPHWRLWIEYARSLRRVELATSERARCALLLLRWPIGRFNWARLAMDLVVGVAPGAWRTHLRVRGWYRGVRRRVPIGRTARPLRRPRGGLT